MRRRLQLLALIALAGCADFSPTDEVTAAERRWKEWGPASYEITIKRSCECLPDIAGPAVVVVKDGVVQSRSYTRDGRPVDDVAAAYFPDVPGLFNLVRAAVRDEITVEVRYDAATGAPLEMVVNRELQPVDGGYNLYVALRTTP